MEKAEILTQLLQQDAEDLAQLYQQLMPEVPQTAGKIMELYQTMRQTPGHNLLAVRCNGHLAGTVLTVVCSSLALNGARFLILEDLVVRDDLRGHGYGKQLLQLAEQLARENHCWAGMLISSASRTGAHRFYRAVGFTDDVVGFRKVYKSLESLL